MPLLAPIFRYACNVGRRTEYYGAFTLLVRLWGLVLADVDKYTYTSGTALNLACYVCKHA